MDKVGDFIARLLLVLVIGVVLASVSFRLLHHFNKTMWCRSTLYHFDGPTFVSCKWEPWHQWE